MNYMASITDFFKSPKWGMNLLLGAVHAIIPIVGPMALMGWMLAGFWGRDDERAETFPDLVFDKFGKNLERGLWPTLVSLVAAVVLVPVFTVLMIMMAVVTGAASGEHGSGALGAMIMLVFVALFVIVAAAVALVMLPMTLRAGLLQDFAPAFNMTFVKRFLTLTKTELALSVLFICGAGFVLFLVAMVPCIGVLLIYAAIPPLQYAWMHLTKQLYTLYIARGGEPLVISPKLRDDPPLPPPAAPQSPPVGPVV
jgi:hypothetical protein